MRPKNCSFIFIIVLVFNNYPLNAQFAKGDKMVGASVASAFFNSGTADQTVTSIGSVTAKVTSFGLSISPEPGMVYFQIKQLLESVLNINPSGEKTSLRREAVAILFNKDKTNTFNIGIGGFVRNYFGNVGSFIPFGQFGIKWQVSVMLTIEKVFFMVAAVPVAYKETVHNGKSSGGFFANSTFRCRSYQNGG